MTYTIHTGTHERRAKNDEFAFKKWPSQPLMMTSPLPTCAGASPSPRKLGKAASLLPLFLHFILYSARLKQNEKKGEAY